MSKTFTVKLVRDLKQSATITVDADSANGAVNRALDIDPNSVTWSTDKAEMHHYEKVEEQHPVPESEEKNITETFGADSSWEAELDISYDGDDLVSYCHISTTRKGRDYCSSIGVVESFGTVEHEDGDAIKVPKYVFNEIHKWALEEGY